MRRDYAMDFDEAEDIAAIDQAGYIRFNGPRRLEKAVNSLRGIVTGLVADARVNDKELAALHLWLGRHREFIDKHPFSELVPQIQQVVADGLVDEEERSDLLWLCEKYASRTGLYDAITGDMQQLQGFLAGIVADARINEIELSRLADWVAEHEHLKSCWPYDELDSIICHVMADGRIDAQEHEALLQFFGEFAITPKRQAIGALDRSCTVSGVCANSPTIEFTSRGFCFTGTSKRSTRAGLVEVIEQRGGAWHKSVRKDTDYLIVGASGNPCWAYSCYGRKVEEAVACRRQGQRLLIVHEFDFWDAVES